MCGRYNITTPAEAMSRIFGIAGPLPNIPARYNVAPTQDVPVVRFNPEKRERSLDMVRWGLIPYWSKDASVGYKLINARAVA
jgi:putative SOS response-associated peptidase YedK